MDIRPASGETMESGPEPAAQGELLVRAENLGVRRGGRWLVAGVDLAVHRGEIVTIVGPNGSGKSTTAKAVIGVLTTDTGTVWRKRGLTVGYLPQRLSIDWSLPLTVERLVTLTAPHPESKVAAALKAVGMAHLAKAKVQQLSGGELQRALLARAMIAAPDLLVLDEPVQGVDFTGEVELYRLIEQARDRTGCGILLISHDLHLVMAQTDTVVCLNGHVCCTGTPSTVAANPEYRKLFGARAAETLAIYSHDHDHTHLPDGRIRHADGTVSAEHPAHEPHDHAHGTATGAQERSDA